MKNHVYHRSAEAVYRQQMSRVFDVRAYGTMILYKPENKLVNLPKWMELI